MEDNSLSSATAWPESPAWSRSSSTRHDFDITIFGDETHVNYNRILLSSVLAGEKSADEIMLNDLDWYQRERHPRCGSAFASPTSIAAQTVTGDDGERRRRSTS